MDEFDVIVISDFRLPGGTNHSTGEELEVHRVHGIRTGLIHCNSRLSTKPRPWSAPIIRNLDGDLIQVVLPNTPVRAKFAILRHPIALEAMPDIRKSVIVDQAIIVANQTAVRPDGDLEYDAAHVDSVVTERLGIKPTWAPIGPVVRSSLEQWGDEIQVRSSDWTNIFAKSTKPVKRSGLNYARPRIGRHSRPQSAKWPDTASEIRLAYPLDNEFEVRILGGAKPAIELLDEFPSEWTVFEFGELDPRQFLEGIDFWVYFHHPQWLEAYGRAIMEALWSGAVVILPDYLRTTYGDAAVYGEPADVRQIIREFRDGERDYAQQSARGQAYAGEHSPDLHLRRLQLFLTEPDQLVERAHRRELSPPTTKLSSTKAPISNRYSEDDRPRALFVTSNGAGMGHLTRMLGIARAVADSVAPVFMSMSQGLGVAGLADFPFEYVPFNSALQTKSAFWHDYFDARLSAAVEHYEAKIVVFDGTWPYRGMLKTFQRHDLLKVWIRRGMWKPHIKPDQLKVATQFDVVIEPGDYARDYDSGATSQVDDAQLVSSMTVLRSDELLSRSEALKELGLEDSADRHYALVTLGAGNINDVSTVQTAMVDAIEAQPGWEAVLTKAPIAFSQATSNAWSISAFPLAKYSNAFDFAVSAAGYNSFSEWMAGSLPTIWVPNLETQTDDQHARSRWAEDAGLGLRLVTEQVDDIENAVSTVIDPSWRLSSRSRLKLLPPATGGEEAASIIRDAWAKRQSRFTRN